MIIDSFSADGKFDISQVWAYFWLPSLQPDIYAVKTQTCRWSHTVNIEVYPDIEWKAAFTISLKNPLAYTHSNKKAGEIFKNAQKKARKSGYDRYQLSQGNAVPEEFSLSLEVSWNDPKITHEVGKEWAKKIHAFLNLLMKIKNMADAVKDSAGGKVKSNKLLGKSTFSIEVYSPVIGAELNWKFEREDDKPHLVSPKGVLSLTADPLIGGEFVIDLLEIAGKANPVVYTIKKGVDLALNQLKRQFVLDLTFYGQLNITLDTVSFNGRTKKISIGKEMMIEGKMGVTLKLEIKFEGEVKFYKKGVEFKFAAEARADAYFGGTLKTGIDDKGLFLDCTGKFSGLLLSAKIEGKVGWFKHTIEFKSDPVLKSDDIPLDKFYFNNE